MEHLGFWDSAKLLCAIFTLIVLPFYLVGLGLGTRKIADELERIRKVLEKDK